MGKISKHFKREEFACKCGCGFDVVDVELLEVLEELRELCGQPITINSACRCKNHNQSVFETVRARRDKALTFVPDNFSNRRCEQSEVIQWLLYGRLQKLSGTKGIDSESGDP